MSAVVQQGQCLLDIAIQHCGDATALLSLAILNNLSVTDEVAAGTALELPAIINQGLVDYYKQNGYVPATAIDPDDAILEGIGFWFLEQDFIVQ